MLLTILQEAHGHAEASGFAEEFWSIFSDPAHIAAEASWEFITGLLLYPVVKRVWDRVLKNHDREVHHVDSHA